MGVSEADGMARASRKGVPDQDIIMRDAITFREFLGRSKMTTQQLEQYGRIVRRRQYLRTRTRRHYEYARGHTALVFRPVEDGWKRIDGTLPQQEKNTEERYVVGTI